MTTSSESKTMVSSPLSSCTITAYSKEELSSILLGDTISTSSDRYADPGLLSTIAAERIISGYASTPSTPSQSHSPLSSFIYTLLHASQSHIEILISSLVQIHQFHSMMSTLNARGVYEFDEACNLFLAAFMAATRTVHGELNYMTFWTKVVDGYYSPVELCLMKNEFVHMMRGWRDPRERVSLLTDSDSETEGTLIESDSDTVVDGDDDDVAKKRVGRRRAVTVSHGRVVARRPGPHDDHEQPLKTTLKTAATRLKASARRRMSI